MAVPLVLEVVVKERWPSLDLQGFENHEGLGIA